MTHGRGARSSPPAKARKTIRRRPRFASRCVRTVLQIEKRRVEFAFAGCDVVTAPDGEQALHLIREMQPRLAILEVSMPFRSGLEVGKAVQNMNAPTAVIFLTSHAQEHDVLEGLRSGASDYLPKPFSPKELQARVRAVLARL